MENEGKQTESYRQRIESFTTDIHQLEENIEELKQEKNQILSVKIEGENEGDERQNLLRQLTQEKVRQTFPLFIRSFLFQSELGSI